MMRIVESIDREVMSVKSGKRFVFSFEKSNEENGWFAAADFTIVGFVKFNCSSGVLVLCVAAIDVMEISTQSFSACPKEALWESLKLWSALICVWQAFAQLTAESAWSGATQICEWVIPWTAIQSSIVWINMYFVIFIF